MIRRNRNPSLCVSDLHRAGEHLAPCRPFLPAAFELAALRAFLECVPSCLPLSAWPKARPGLLGILCPTCFSHRI